VASSRLHIDTRAPSVASARATPYPNPLLAAETSATLPCNPKSI